MTMDDDWIEVNFDSHIFSNWQRMFTKIQYLYMPQKGLPEILNCTPTHPYNLRKLERRNMHKKNDMA